jgi:hypothetical protein
MHMLRRANLEIARIRRDDDATMQDKGFILELPSLLALVDGSMHHADDWLTKSSRYILQNCMQHNVKVAVTFWCGPVGRPFKPTRFLVGTTLCQPS